MVGIKLRPAPAPVLPPAAAVPPSDFAALFKDVVDFLVPELPGFDAAAYLYMLRRSIGETGRPHLRISMLELRTKVVRAHNGRMVSFQSVQRALRALERIGAIRKESAPRRGGTVYRILMHGEIEACRQAKRAQGEAAARPAPVIDVKAEVDYYNVRANRVKIFERDGYACRYCAKQLMRHTATLDHMTPVSAGGGHGWDNLVTACFECNASETGNPLGDFLAERDETARA